MELRVAAQLIYWIGTYLTSQSNIVARLQAALWVLIRHAITTYTLSAVLGVFDAGYFLHHPERRGVSNMIHQSDIQLRKYLQHNYLHHHCQSYRYPLDIRSLMIP